MEVNAVRVAAVRELFVHLVARGLRRWQFGDRFVQRYIYEH